MYGKQYSLVVKPRSGYGAKGLSIVNNFKELELIFNLTEEKFGSPLVQEYIPQDGAQYQVEMIMDRNMKCKMFILLDKVRWYPLNGGSSTMNITLHNEKIYDSCINLLKRIGWRGYASLDLICDTRSDTAKILEINPRINGTVKICFYCGIDVSRMIMQDVFENDIDENIVYQDGLGIRYFHMDILWFLKSKKRFKANPSWFTWKHTVDEIFEWKNLKPGICYSLTAFKKIFHDRDSRFVK